MKMYLYYATEENCYETEKHESENPIEDVKQFLKDDGLSDDEIGEIANKMVVEYSQKGYAMEETVNAVGYGIIIGFAHFGKCWCVSNHISEERKIAISYCK